MSPEAAYRNVATGGDSAMTVSTEVDHNDYVGNGVTTQFPYTFRVFKKSDLVVTVLDLSQNITTLILDTDYTVSGAGGYTGGNVTLSSPLTSGWQISIARVLPVTQETDLRNQGKFFAEVHEDVFDRLTMLLQQAFSSFRLSLRKPSTISNWYDALNNYIRNLRDPSQPQDAATKNYVDNLSSANLNKTLRVPEGYIPELPSVELRKNKIVGMDSVGNPIMLLPQSGSASDVLLQLASADDGKGDALSTVKQPYTGSLPRNQHDFNAQFVSITDCLGEAYSGATDASSAIYTWNASVPKGKVIYVRSGTYLLNSDVDCYGRHFIFEEPVTFTGTGYLKRAVIHRYDGNTGSMSVASNGVRGSDLNPQFGTMFRFGSNAGNVTGLQVGGGDPVNGTDGLVQFIDGYAGWMTSQPSKYPSPVEMAIQPATRAGRCTTVSGTNTVTVNTGPGLTSDEVGKTIWLKDAGYTVLSVAAGSFTVKNLNGSAVSFPSSVSSTYVCCYIWGRGKCNVAGTAITRISGDPFVPLNNIITTFTVNGVTTTQAGYTDSWNATLTASAGTASNVDYYWWGSVDNLVAAMRVHRVSGAGFEENVSLIASAKGFYHLHAGAGGTDQYPLYIGSGYDGDGTARRQITVDGGNGIVTIGGGYGRAAAEFGYRDFSTGDVNRFRFDGATTGNPPALTAVGPDANINTILAAKGTGFIQTNSELRANAAIYPNIDNVYSNGKVSLRWTIVYATNGVNQTSDEREKDIEEILENEISAAQEISKNIIAYKWKNKSNECGVGDRRFGVSVQKVMEIMTKHGLRWEDYSMFSYDEESDRYGLNYSELLSFAMAGLAAKM